MPSLTSIIKQASRGADLYFVFRFLRILTMKWTATDAYKYKIIDKKGNALRKSGELESTNEKAAYTMLHRMVFKIRRLIEKVPLIGKSILLNYAAALFLLKEQKDTRVWTDEKYMTRKLMEFLETDWKADAEFLQEEIKNKYGKTSASEFLIEEVEIDEALSRKDQLKLALAKSKFKRSGGKVEKQPPSPATGSKKYRGIHMAAPKTKEDEKMAKDIQDYRKKMGKKNRYFPAGKKPIFPNQIMKREEVEIDEQHEKEEAPPGWEGTVKAMKKKKDITNPWALAWYMHNKGDKPHVPEGNELKEIQMEDIKDKILNFGEFQLDEISMEAGKVYHQDTSDGPMYFKAVEQQKNKRWKGLILDIGQKKPKNGSADEKLRFWQATPDKDIPKALKEEVEIDEIAPWKKGKYKVTDGKTGKVLATFNSGEKAQKYVDKIWDKGDYDSLTVELGEAKGTAYPATIDTLKKIVKDKQHQTVMFKSGQAIVDLFTASAMVQVYDALKPALKKTFEKMIKDKAGFMKTQAFAMKMMEETEIEKPFIEEMKLDEEVPTVSTAGVAGLDTGLTFKKKKEDEKKAKILRKKLIGEIKMTKFAGKDVFIVNSEIYHACRLGKKQYAKYEKYVGKETIGLAIREFGLKYPKRPIILQNGESGPMLYLKYGRS